MEMKDLPTDRSGRVRDQRIERVVELVSPAQILDDLPLSAEQEDAVLARPRRGRGHPRPRGRPPARGRRAVQRPRRRRRARVRPAPERSGRRPERRPLHRDARLLREAAHDDRLEGPDQRPAPGRQRRRQHAGCTWPAGCCSRCSTWACRSAASSSTRSRRSTSPTWSPGARSAPARPRARSTASSPRACRCRSASRTAPTATSRSRSTRSAPPAAQHAFAGRRRRAARRRSCTPSGNPDCHVILRGGRGAPNYDADARRRGAGAARGAPACRERLVIDASHDNSGKDHERQPQVVSRDRRPDRGRQRGDRRRDAGVVPGRRPPGPRARTADWSTASRSPTPAWTGTRPSWRSTGWRRPCASAATPAERPPMKIAVLGVGLIGGSIGLAARGEARRARWPGSTRTPSCSARAEELGAIDEARRLGRRGGRGRRGGLLRGAGGAPCPSSPPRRSTPPARTRRSPTSARSSARRSPRSARTRASSAATRSPAPRPRGSRTPAPTCSTGRAGT